MAKATPVEKNKSDLVRDFLSGHSNANIKEIVAGVKRENGVDVSEALASRIKYDKGRQKSAKTRTSNGRKPSSRSAPAGKAGTKADAIREAAQGMPKPVRPRDIIAALAEKGITASNAQVGQVLKSMGMRRRGRGRVPAASIAIPAARSVAISIDDLIAAKKLADQLGGVAAAKEAVDALAKLR